MSMAPAPHNKPRMGRVNVVPWVRCANRRCDKVIAQRYEPWVGNSIWVQCRRCGQMNRISEGGVMLVDQAGDTEPMERGNRG